MAVLLSRWRQTVPMLVVLAVAVGSSYRAATSRVVWTNDSLFYQARALSLRGANERAEFDKLLRSPVAGPLRRADEARPPAIRRLTRPAWVEEYRQSVRRRVLVPALAAAVYPLFGLRSLLAVSIVGYAVFGLLLYALLRRRFAVGPSLAVVCLCLLLPPLRNWSFHPLTDSWGLALETASLLAAVLVLDRGLRWLPFWLGAIAALSLTRDTAVIPVLASVWVAARFRTRRAASLPLGGLALALPAPLLFGNPVHRLLDWAAHHFRDGYLGELRGLLSQDVFSYTIAPDQRLTGLAIVSVVLVLLVPHWQRLDGFRRVGVTGLLFYVGAILLVPIVLPGLAIFGGATMPTGLVVVAGLMLLLLPARADAFFSLHRAGALGAIAYMAGFPVASDFRYELVFLPLAAVGLARAASRWPAPAQQPEASGLPSADRSGATMAASPS